MSSNKYAGRQSNLELLRIIAAIGVVVLHYNNASIGGAFAAVNPNSKGAVMLYLSEALFIGCVDLFMMLFGRFQAGRDKAKISKVILLLLQVSIVRIIYYLLIDCAFKHKAITLLSLFKVLMPSNYFIITYCVIYLLSPYINSLMKTLSQTGKKRLVLLLIILFSFCPMVLAMLKNHFGIGVGGLSTVTTNGDISGYTVVNYFVMYCIGAVSNDIKISRIKSAVGFAACYILLCIMELSMQYAGLFKGIAHSYCNPLAVGCAFFSLMFFSSLKVNSAAINKIAGGSLMVFLTHKYYFPLFNIKKYVSMGGFTILVHLLLVCICTYVFGWLLSWIYGILLKPIRDLINKKTGQWVICARMTEEQASDQQLP